MDQAQSGARGVGFASRLGILAEAAVAQGQLLRRQGTRVYYRTAAALAHTAPMAPLPFLAAMAVVGIAVITTTMYTPAYVVTVDGETLGMVRNEQVFPRVQAQVEARVSDILGEEYHIDHEVDYEFALTQQTELTNEAELEAYLFNGVDAVSENYVFTVDGQVMGAAADRAEFDALLEEIAAPYINENTTSVAYTKSIEIAQEYTPSDLVVESMDDVFATLTANTNGQTTYEVQQGDTFMALAYANNMTMDEMEALNPDADINRLYIGQILNVKEEIPYLGVQTTESVTYTEEIPCTVVQVDDDTMYQGESKVLDAGIPGEARLTADVTYLNGVEKERNVTSTATVRAATEKVIAVGTMTRPTWYPTGNYTWPIYGSITSAFGYRSIFGSTSFHSGIDISASYGSAIRAADGGTVSFAGYQGSYGNLVIIDHSNGEQTYYAHNSALYVSVGYKVYQGETIAAAGATGRATGVHCHFEIKINGTSVNPASYLH